MKLLILSSSRGTTMEAVLQAMDNGTLDMDCIGLITDKESRGCVEKARQAGIRVEVLTRGTFDRESYDKKLHSLIVEMGGMPDDTIIAALGWMYILSPWFVREWSRRIVNVHPSLLPKHPGAHAITDALQSGDTESGMTIHYIDEGVDTGEIIEQKSCTIEAGETEQSLKEKIQALEKEWYPKVLASLK